MDIHAPASDNIDELRRIADANGIATDSGIGTGIGWACARPSSERFLVPSVCPSADLPPWACAQAQRLTEGTRMASYPSSDDRRPPGVAATCSVRVLGWFVC